MSWKPRFSIRQCLIGSVLVALLLVCTKFVLDARPIQAVALLRVHMANAETINLSPATPIPDYSTVKRQVIQDLTSQDVINDAIASFESQRDQDSAARLLATVEADYPGDSEILSISVTGHAGKNSELECIQAGDALCQAYLSETIANTNQVNKVQLLQSAIVPNPGGSFERMAWTIASAIAVVILLFVLYGEKLLSVIKRLRSIGQAATERSQAHPT